MEQNQSPSIITRLEHILLTFAIFHSVGMVLIFLGQVVLSLATGRSWIKKASFRNAIWTGVGVTIIASGPFVLQSLRDKVNTFDCEVVGRSLVFKTKPIAPEVYVITGNGQPVPLTKVSDTQYAASIDIGNGEDVRIVDDGHTLVTKPKDQVWIMRIVLIILGGAGVAAFLGGVQGKEYY